MTQDHQETPRTAGLVIEPCPECGTPCTVEKHKLHVHYTPVEAEAAARQVTELRAAVEALFDASPHRCSHDLPVVHATRVLALLAGDKAEAPRQKLGWETFPGIADPQPDEPRFPCPTCGTTTEDLDGG